ncbi:nuclear export mediator factor nemf-like [Plakobranchus ocellatus]|uniref:Nuclear export mediator factor nemf-like n=1 Tax=Plakobranchus ocellatus TaxID=259542 RepID=A0AAV4A1L2_9GAST|nr:nuclear export mediator factor nemf-like [Plakobranchus ocellatus]
MPPNTRSKCIIGKGHLIWRKNYLPPSYLIYGFGFLFKLEEGSVERHLGERRVRTTDADSISVTDSTGGLSPMGGDDDTELEFSNSSEDENNAENDCAYETSELQNKAEENENIDAEMRLEDNLQENECAEEEEDNEGEETKERMAVEQAKEEETKKVGSAQIQHKHEKEITTDEFMFPDTNINLTHVKGDKYELQRDLIAASEASEVTDTFFLGDGTPVVLGERVVNTTKKISAKQRREMKKQRKDRAVGNEPGEDEEEEAVSWLKSEKPPQGMIFSTDEKKDDNERCISDDEEENGAEGSSHIKSPQTVGPTKRGQKAKKKKIKEKYADQDEEERQLRMEILASAGSQREDKRKKVKKGKEQQSSKISQSLGSKVIGKGQTQKQAEGKAKAEENALVKDVQKLHMQDNMTTEMIVENSAETITSQLQKKTQDADFDEEKEDTIAANDERTLNSLTGIPLPEDEILYAVPVCAPYTTLLNYKYKVKLMPGSTKKGKAVKAALNMFIHEKTSTTREKDLLRIQKDVDISRNMPGKVKVAAPNLHKNKR